MINIEDDDKDYESLGDIGLIQGLEKQAELKKSLKGSIDALKNKRYSIMGIENQELDCDLINYCYEVDDEIAVGNAND